MARPIWKGAVAFGLVTVPVALHPATARRKELTFHLLHARDKSRVDFKRFCRREAVEIPWSDVVKGYEYAKDRYVVITDEDFEKARVPATHTFEVRDFVPVHDIQDLYFDQPYYVAPAGRGAAKPYALLRDALSESGRAGVGTIVIRQREHLAALEPAGRTLVLTTMRFAHEIRSAASLDVPGPGQVWSKREMTLARQLIQSLAADWEPTRYRDTYTEALRQAIKRKIAGHDIAAPIQRPPARVVDLMQALQSSLETRGGRRRAGTTDHRSVRVAGRRARRRHAA